MTGTMRRVAVTAVAALTALLASALPLHGFGIVVVVALAGLDILLLQATGWLAFRRGPGLDERQTAVRDLAYRRGFRWIGPAVLLLWLVWFLSYVAVMAGSSVSAGDASDGGIAGRVLVGMAELVIMMPTCVVAWREDGGSEAEGVAAGWGASQVGDEGVPPLPGAVDQGVVDELADREMDVQAVPARMPLRDPDIGQPVTQRRPQAAHECRHVRPGLGGVVAARRPVGQRPQVVQPVRGAVQADLPPGPAPRLEPITFRRSVWVEFCPPGSTTAGRGLADRAPTLRRGRAQHKLPGRPIPYESIGRTTATPRVHRDSPKKGARIRTAVLLGKPSLMLDPMARRP